MDGEGNIWPPGCGRARARTRGGAGQKMAEKALDTANQLANVMASHVELQREQLRASSSSSSTGGRGSSQQDTLIGVSIGTCAGAAWTGSRTTAGGTTSTPSRRDSESGEDRASHNTGAAQFCSPTWMQDTGSESCQGRAQPNVVGDCCRMQKNRSLSIDKPGGPGNEQVYQLINSVVPGTERFINLYSFGPTEI